MSDQIVDAGTAQSLTIDARRNHTLVAWVVTRDEPAYPDQFVARLMTDRPGSYVLLADSLAEIQAQLPAKLTRYERTPAEPADVVEIWFSE